LNGKPFYRRPLFVVPALLVLGLIVWFLFFRDSVPRLSEDGARDKAVQFLDQIRGGQIDTAWEETSTDFKSMYGRDRFREYVRSKPVLKSPAEFAKCDFKSEGSLRLAECLFRPAGGKGSITVVLHPDQKTWRVGRLSVE
jgi:hypothetical protein